MSATSQTPATLARTKASRGSLVDRFLICAWVVTYAGVLVLFQLARALERLRPKPEAASATRS
jgi:hypothetical protein